MRDLSVHPFTLDGERHENLILATRIVGEAQVRMPGWHIRKAAPVGRRHLLGRRTFSQNRHVRFAMPSLTCGWLR